MKELVCKHCSEKIILMSYLGDLKWFHAFPTIRDCGYSYQKLNAEPDFSEWEGDNRIPQPDAQG